MARTQPHPGATAGGARGGARLGCTASIGSRTLAVSPEVQGLGLPKTGCSLGRELGQGAGQKRRASGGCLPSTSEVTLPPLPAHFQNAQQASGSPCLSSPRQSAVCGTGQTRGAGRRARAQRGGGSQVGAASTWGPHARDTMGNQSRDVPSAPPAQPSTAQ